MLARAALAPSALCALLLRTLAPVEAASPTVQVDPRIVKLIKTACGDEHVVVKPTPAPSGAQHVPAMLLLLAQAESTPTPAASASASPAPSGAPPTAAPTPTASPLPKAPPGPVELVPPAPQGTFFPTPPPAPTPTPPGATATGPVYLVAPSGTPPAIPAVGGSARPRPPPTAPPQTGPTPAPTLCPFQMATAADHIHAWNNDQHQPGDAIGSVHIFYSEGQLIGDRAHYDGDHTITLTGHTYLINRNRDSVLYGDGITFDTNTNKVVMLNGYG